MKSSMMKSSLPALATILLCFLVQAVQQGFQIGTPRTLNVSTGDFSTAIVFNLSLLASLPLIGAISASLAKSLGHSRKAAVESVISPVAIVCAMLLALLLATSTEVLQHWVPGRHPMVRDALIDLAGALVGCTLQMPLRNLPLFCKSSSA